jgi:CrcB protein
MRDPRGVRGAMMNYLIVFLGGGIGSALRHGVNRASMALFGTGFPAGTLFVNIVGSTLMGIIVGVLASRSGDTQSFRLFLTTGIMGGFTTFSAFSLDTAFLWQRGEHLTAAIYVAASVAVSIAGLFIGMAVTRSLA